MIVRPQTNPRHHDFITYDFEWNGEKQWSDTPIREIGQHIHEDKSSRSFAKLGITLCGAYDKARGYRAYKTLEEFVDGELTTENSGCRFYAHFGGASDMVFLITVLAKRKDLSIRAIFSSSSAIMVSVKDRYNRTWMFLDSFWTMRTGLRSIGKWLGAGNEKGDLDHSKSHSWEVLKEYNEQDCKILYTAIERFQLVINDAGGELRVTGASTALDLFLRRYLKRPIRNSREIDEYVRPAYKASRVEALARKMVEGKVYDINSSFPYSFTFPCPGGVIDSLKTLPNNPDVLWCADVDVTVKEQFLPPLPYRGEKDGRLFFPTGSFRTRLTSEDLKCGDFVINKVHSCWTFEDRDDLGQYAEDLFALRQGSSGFESQVWKIIVNSLYGKWAEGEDKEFLLINPTSVDPKLEGLAPGIFLGTEKVPVDHSHVPFSTFITARSRRLLREHALVAYNQTGIVSYLDTDSIFTTADLPTSNKLGGLKLESSIQNGFFQGAKLYAYEKLVENSDPVVLVKAKGFSRVVSEGGQGEERLSYEDFISLTQGSEMQVERMRRIKELVRENKGFDFIPDAVRTSKRLGTPTPKRCFQGDYNSRPWTVEEIAA
jgi:DNA polymerase type B, organellar and viral